MFSLEAMLTHPYPYLHSLVGVRKWLIYPPLLQVEVVYLTYNLNVYEGSSDLKSTAEVKSNKHNRYIYTFGGCGGWGI